jgi:hypothetical protein
MDTPLYIISKIIIDEKNTEITSIFGVYTSPENLIKQLRYIYREEYKTSIEDNIDLEYAVGFRMQLLPQYIKELNEYRKSVSVFSNYVEYRIYKCNQIDKIVDV